MILWCEQSFKVKTHSVRSTAPPINHGGNKVYIYAHNLKFSHPINWFKITTFVWCTSGRNSTLFSGGSRGGVGQGATPLILGKKKNLKNEEKLAVHAKKNNLPLSHPSLTSLAQLALLQWTQTLWRAMFVFHATVFSETKLFVVL